MTTPLLQIQYRLGAYKEAIAVYSQLFRAHGGEAAAGQEVQVRGRGPGAGAWQAAVAAGVQLHGCIACRARGGVLAQRCGVSLCLQGRRRGGRNTC